MDEVIDLVVSCSKRKKTSPAKELSLSEVPDQDLTARAKRWISNLRTVPAMTHPAEQLYAGDHWKVVRAIAANAVGSPARIRVWVCSAGYGLIPLSAPLKPYSATFTADQSDSVSQSKDAQNVSADNQRWWKLIAEAWTGPTPDEPRLLHQIPEKYGKHPMFVALSSDYLAATVEDLNQLLSDPYFRDNLTIVSAGFRNKSMSLAPNILPCDATMQPSVGGARVSLNVRLAAYLLGHLRTHTASYADFRNLCENIERHSQATAQRKRLTNEEVEAFIRSETRENPMSSRTTLLRILRERQLACEQSRFAKIHAAILSTKQRAHYA